MATPNEAMVKFKNILTTLRAQNPTITSGLEEEAIKQLSDDDISALRTASLTGATSVGGGVTSVYRDPQLARQIDVESTRRRLGSQEQPSRIEEIFGSPVQTTPFDIGKLETEEAGRTAAQRNILGRIFGERQRQALGDIEEQSLEPKKRLVEELAATGALRQGTGANVLSRLAAEKQRIINKVLSDLSGKRAEQEFGLESEAAQRLARAREFGTQTGLSERELGLREKTSLSDLLGEESRFGRSLGLEKEKLFSGIKESEEERGLKKYLGELESRTGLEAARLKQPKEEEALDKIFGIVKTGVDIATGIGGKGKSGGLFGRR